MKLLLIFILLAQTARATDRSYKDIKASSPDGHFLAKAESPENRKSKSAPFQSNFTFSLTDLHTQKLLWRYRGGEDSEPAGALFVSNSGRVISLGGYDQLTLFRPSGERIQLPGIFDLLPKRDVKRYCDATTAGTFWQQFSWKGFLNVAGREYFYIRTYWGRYILVDLERERIATDRSVRDTIEAHVLAEARKIKLLPAKKYRTYCAECDSMEVNPAIQKAIFVLVQYQEGGIDAFMRLIFSSNDNISPDAKDYLPRLDAKLEHKFPSK
jgi:hypothetical protein